MSFLLSRKKSSRFSWIDNGLLILGILGISHQTVAKLLFGDPAPQTQSATAVAHHQPAFSLQSYQPGTQQFQPVQPGTQQFSVPSPQSLLASQWNDSSNRYGNYLPSAGYQPQNPFPTPVGNAQRPNTYTPATADTTNPNHGYWPASNSGVPQNQNSYGMPNGNNAQPQYSGQQYSGQMPSQYPASSYPSGSAYNPNTAPSSYGNQPANVPFGTNYPPNASYQPTYGPLGSLNNTNGSYSSHYGAPSASTAAYNASAIPWPPTSGLGVSSNTYVPATNGSAVASIAAREGWPSNYASGGVGSGYPFSQFVPAGSSYPSSTGNSYASPALTPGGAWQTTIPYHPQQPNSYPVR